MACQTNPQAVLNCNPVIGWIKKRCTSLVTLADCPLAFEVPPQTPFGRKLITFSMTMCVEQLKVTVYLQSWIHLESLSSLLKFSPHYHHLGTCGYTTCKIHCYFLKVDLLHSYPSLIKIDASFSQDSLSRGNLSGINQIKFHKTES